MGAYRMPSLGAEMETGTVARWLVAPGDVVHKGDIVAAIETDKATIDAEIFEDGVVEALLVEEGDEVPVGTPLATISSAPGAAPAPATSRHRPRRSRGRGTPPATPTPVAPSPGGERVHSPVVRHLAATLGVDLDHVVGSGPAGAITRADVEAAAAGNVAVPVAEPSPPPTSSAASGAPLRAVPPPAVRAERTGHVRASPFVRRSARERNVDLASVEGTGEGGIVTLADLERAGAAPAAAAVDHPARAAHPARPTHPAGDERDALRRQTALVMARSKREIPHYYLTSTIELGTTMAFLAERNRDRPPSERLLPVAALLKATALAAREVPRMNGFYVEGAFEAADAVHLGVAIALRGGGLVAPAIHDVDALTLDEVMAAMRDLVARARAGRLRSSEMADATLTVTSLGDLGVDAVLGVIYPPQVALVGFGTVAERPYASGGLVGARPVVTASLAADHRVSDGHEGARFLRALASYLHDLEAL